MMKRLITIIILLITVTAAYADNQSGVWHTLQAGETLYRLSRMYGVPVQSIMDYNHISDPSSLAVGQRIFIPGGSAATVPPAPQPAATVSGGTNLRIIAPVRGSVIKRFGAGNRMNGIDIAANENLSVVAAAAGVVEFVGQVSGYGTVVIIRHNSAYTTVYGGLRAASVSKGQTVRQGQLIGRVGRLPHESRSFLHFQIFRSGSAVNPASYLS